MAQDILYLAPLLWSSPEPLPHDYGDFVFCRAGGIEVALDAPYFEAVAQVELDSGIIDILRLQDKRPAIVLTRPVRGTVEQQGTNAIAAKMATDENITDAGD